MQKKFNPKPGDKIICNNGEEFICCTEEFLMSKGYWIHGNEIIFGYSNNPENGTAGVYWNTWNQAGESTGASLPWYIREVIPQKSEVTDDKKKEVKEDSLYTVDEVFDAIFETTKHLQIEIPWDYIDDVKEHLSRKNDPQYLEFLRLKEIYE